MKLGAKTDIEAGTITSADAGSMEEERQSLFNPATCGGPGARADAVGAPGCISGGFVISRSLEYSSRKAGVRFMLNRHMDQIIREGPHSENGIHSPGWRNSGRKHLPRWNVG